VDNFIFNRSPTRLSYETASLPSGKGGIGAPHVESYIQALKARWLCSYLSSPHQIWALLFRWKLDKITSLLGIKQPFSAAIPVAAKKFGIVGEALYAWSLIRRSPNFNCCPSDLASSFPILDNLSIVLPNALVKRLRRVGLHCLKNFLSDDKHHWLSSEQLRSLFRIRLSKSDLNLIQKSIPFRFLLAACQGKTKLKVGDWLEQKSKITAVPAHYIQINKTLANQHRVQMFLRSTSGLLTASGVPFEIDCISISQLYRKVFVKTSILGAIYIGDLFEEATVISRVEGDSLSDLITETNFKSLRTLFHPLPQTAIPRQNIAGFNYDRAYSWIGKRLFDKPFATFALKLVTRKLAFCSIHQCHLCGIHAISFNHTFFECPISCDFLKMIRVIWEDWFPESPFFSWVDNLCFGTHLSNLWNLVALCAKSCIYSATWAHHFNNNDTFPYPSAISIAKAWIKKLRDFLLAVSLRGLKASKRWDHNNAWFHADGSLNSENLSL
jgi:hypothetical protein